MDALIDKINFKVLVAALFLLVIVIIILIFVTGNPSSQRLQNSNNSNQTAMVILKDPDLTLSYPQEVTVTESTVEGGGRALIFHLPQGPDYRMQLQILPKSLTSVDNIARVFRIFKYQENNILIDGKNAINFKGTSLTGGQTVQDMIAVAEYQNQVYEFELIYNLPQRNPEVDKLFSEILKTFHFNH